VLDRCAGKPISSIHMPGPLARKVHCAAIAASLIVSFCAGLVILPHADCLDDFGCNPVFIFHDETSHRIGGASSSGHGDALHCYLCHWSRSFCPLSPAVAHDASLDEVEHLRAISLVGPTQIEWSLTPGRAPPA
jgi:hypothetical protein